MLINYFVVAVKLSKIYLGLTQSILYEWSCGIHVTEKNHLDEQINVIRSNIVNRSMPMYRSFENHRRFNLYKNNAFWKYDLLII